MTTSATLYKLFLGDQDSTTGHYRRGFTVHTITAAIFPNGGAFAFGSLGYHTVYSCVGFTQYDVNEGDVIYTDTEQYYLIKSPPKRWPENGTFQFYELELERQDVFPFLAGFFGFEDEDHGTIGYGFETGFESGIWAL